MTTPTTSDGSNEVDTDDDDTMSSSSVSTPSRGNTEREPVRVLYIVDETAHDSRSADLARLLTRIQIQQTQAAVCCLAPLDDGTEAIQGADVPVVSLELPPRSGPRAWLDAVLGVQRLRTLLDKFRPQVVHAIGPRAGAWAPLAVSLADAAPLIVSPTDVPRPRGFAQMASRWTRSVARPWLEADDVGPSFQVKWRGAKSDDGESVAVIPRGVEIPSVRGAPPLSEDEFVPGPFDVAFPLRPGGTDLVRRYLDPFRLVAALRDDARLVVMTSEATPPSLAPWTDDFGLADRVVVYSLPSEPARLIRSCRVMWLPEHSGGADHDMILRALCCGVPVVCDMRNPFRRDIEQIGGALMRDASWPSQFAEATRDLSDDEGLTAAVSRAGKVLVDQRYGFGAHVTAWRDLYAEIAIDVPPDPAAS